MNEELLIEKYKELLKTIEDNANDFSEEEISVFNFLKGRDYDDITDNSKIIIYGQAVNGWNCFDKDTVSDHITKIMDNNSLDWVVRDWGNSKAVYDPNKSQFWRVFRMTLADLFGENSIDVINKAVWSNLYKVSNSESRNPSTQLENIQREKAREIVKIELDLLNPDIAIFLTSSTWANTFLEHLGIEEKIFNNTFDYVEFICKYKNTLIVVGPHPRSKKEIKYKDEIIAAIKIAKEHYGIN